jgi:hypothetical protein
VLRLVRDGPEIPLQVLAAHEQERLVFFCGAGISMETGLLYSLHMTASSLELQIVQ